MTQIIHNLFHLTHNETLLSGFHPSRDLLRSQSLVSYVASHALVIVSLRYESHCFEQLLSFFSHTKMSMTPGHFVCPRRTILTRRKDHFNQKKWYILTFSHDKPGSHPAARLQAAACSIIQSRQDEQVHHTIPQSQCRRRDGKRDEEVS